MNNERIKYKYATAQEWMADKIGNHANALRDRVGGENDFIALVDTANVLLQHVDNDCIQDAYQNQMSEAGFFTPIYIDQHGGEVPGDLIAIKFTDPSINEFENDVKTVMQAPWYEDEKGLLMVSFSAVDGVIDGDVEDAGGIQGVV